MCVVLHVMGFFGVPSTFVIVRESRALSQDGGATAGCRHSCPLLIANTFSQVEDISYRLKKSLFSDMLEILAIKLQVGFPDCLSAV